MAKRTKRATPNHVFSHWFKMIDGFHISPSEFYKLVEAKIDEHKIPNLKTTEITCKEGGVLSAKRVYLRITRKGKIFDICGAPFGSDFFISWWLGDKRPGLFKTLAALMSYIPLIGDFLEGYRGKTYFQIDTMLMFQQAVHSAVTEAVDGMLETKGMRPLSDLDKKPNMSF